MQHLWVPPFLVIAQDETAFEALAPIAPGHVVLAPTHLRVADGTAYALPGSRELLKVLEPWCS